MHRESRVCSEWCGQSGEPQFLGEANLTSMQKITRHGLIKIRLETVKLVKESRENVSCHWPGQYFKNIIPKLQAVKAKMTNGIALN